MKKENIDFLKVKYNIDVNDYKEEELSKILCDIILKNKKIILLKEARKEIIKNKVECFNKENL